MKKIAVLVVSIVVAATACGVSESTTSTTRAQGTVAASTTDPSALVDSGLCDRNNTVDCATVGLVFESSLALSDVLELLEGWLVVAVFRTDPACVVVPNWPDNEDGVHEESRFAYVDAPLIRERRLNAPGSPPITGHHIASGYWSHFEAEWRSALQDDAMIATAVVYAPIGTTPIAAGVAGVSDVVAIPSYRTDTVDERFAGELYIEGHEIPPELGGPTDRATCTV